MELISIAGSWCQNCWNFSYLAVVEERGGRGVALVPVVGVAGLRLIAKVALLGLVYLTTQLDFYGIAFSAARRDGE